MQTDVDSLENDTLIELDICIIGAGPAGLILAHAFIGTNFTVSLLESGGLSKNSKIQKLSEGTLSGDLSEPIDQTHIRQVGGTANHWIIKMADKRYGYRYAPLISKEKLFIARRGARGLINHQAIANMLNKIGYTTIFMEDYTIGEQLGIASQAKDVVAVHGASMGMFVLNKQLNSLIEICPPNVYHEYFAVALAQSVKKHIQIIPSFDSNVGYSGWDAIVHFKNKPFSANESQLELALSMLN